MSSHGCPLSRTSAATSHDDRGFLEEKESRYCNPSPLGHRWTHACGGSSLSEGEPRYSISAASKGIMVMESVPQIHPSTSKHDHPHDSPANPETSKPGCQQKQPQTQKATQTSINHQPPQSGTPRLEGPPHPTLAWLGPRPTAQEHPQSRQSPTLTRCEHVESQRSRTGTTLYKLAMNTLSPYSRYRNRHGITYPQRGRKLDVVPK